MNGIMEGIIGNSIFTMVQKAFRKVNTSIDSNLEERLSIAVEKASEEFYDKYEDRFGDKNSSFIVRQENIDAIVRSLYYSNQSNLIEEITDDGFDNAIKASEEAIEFFVTRLEIHISSDYELNKIMTEKKHIKEHDETLRRIMEVLEEHVGSDDDTKEDQQNPRWIMRDAFGNKSDVGS